MLRDDFGNRKKRIKTTTWEHKFYRKTITSETNPNDSQPNEMAKKNL